MKNAEVITTSVKLVDTIKRKRPILTIFKGFWTGEFDTNWDGHHDGGVVGRGGQFPLSENALSGWVFLNNLH